MRRCEDAGFVISIVAAVFIFVFVVVIIEVISYLFSIYNIKYRFM